MYKSADLAKWESPSLAQDITGDVTHPREPRVDRRTARMFQGAYVAVLLGAIGWLAFLIFLLF